MFRPILVTGAHRSGTTWVGKMIARSSAVHYIHEPFNLENKAYKFRPHYWFQYITRETETPLYEHIKKLVTLKKRPLLFSLLKNIPAKQRVLIKDPIAIFSAEWLASRFNMDVVVMIRHPAAFVSSIKGQNWLFNFNNFLAQPLLMKEHLSPFKEEIIRFTKKKYDIIDQAVLLWKSIYHTAAKYREKHKDWLFVKHEDLSADPIRGFQEIFEKLNIKYSKNIKKTIEIHSSTQNPVDGNFDTIKRDSKANIKRWRYKLTVEEIERIKSGVEKISTRFYNDKDWESSNDG